MYKFVFLFIFDFPLTNTYFCSFCHCYMALGLENSSKIRFGKVLDSNMSEEKDNILYEIPVSL